ncbi:MAG: glycogen synthase [Verrucomicrobia bacterium]|nr:glycogen synthase [Verrucomicrobiota bacterium]
MNIGILTNEYPPHVYGGAGVHVEYLTRELARLDGGRHAVKVLCFGDQKITTGNPQVEGIQPSFDLPAHDPRHAKFFDTLLRDIMMAGTLADVDVVHCHTWYSHYAGCLVKQLQQVPLVLTTHSLEPHRPWKVEQLGTAYNTSTWIERTAYQNADGVVAVSQSMRRDVHDLYDVPFDKIRVIHNGIDLNLYRPTPNPAVLKAYGVNPDKPYILFVGRITRQKGIIHLVNAIKHVRDGVQIVLCAGAPDTKEIGGEMAEAVARAKHQTKNEMIWVEKIVPKNEIVSLYTHATLFVCPSVYEPFGIINLEAMACGTPVVASAVGGIPEAVVHGETGMLVPIEPVSETNVEPRDPEQFARNLATAINTLLDSPARLQEMAAAARRRVEEHFGWPAIARQTLEFYQQLVRS